MLSGLRGSHDSFLLVENSFEEDIVKAFKAGAR